MHLIDESVGFMGAMPVVGDYVSMAIGSAIAFKLDGSQRMAIAFFGDSTVETGQFWEAANFAALHRLPIMFVCENNQYATATHIDKRQPAGPIHERVSTFMPSYWVEDHELEKVFLAAENCRATAPALLEISTYRFRAHVGPDQDWGLGFRDKEEVLQHMANDTVLAARKKLSDADADGIEQEINSRVLAAFEDALSAPWPEAIKR